MIRALSLSAALALLPLSSALAHEAAPSPEAARFEAAAEAFGERMADFGARAGAIGEDATLSELEREVRIAEAWAEYQPEVTAFTAAATVFATTAAAEALAEIDVEALVSVALAEADLAGSMALASGVITNSAWTNPDPDQLETYGLVAQYAVDQALEDDAD